MCLLSSGYAFLASVLRTEYQFTRGTSSTGRYRHRRRFFFFLSASYSFRELCSGIWPLTRADLLKIPLAHSRGISDIGTNKNCECFSSIFARPSINYRIRMLSDLQVSIHFACDISITLISFNVSLLNILSFLNFNCFLRVFLLFLSVC